MNADTFQAGSSGRQFRSLKIETTGDFYRGKIKPGIRLAGKWLEQAGFKPGHRVEVRLNEPGSMTLLFMKQAHPQRAEANLPGDPRCTCGFSKVSAEVQP